MRDGQVMIDQDFSDRQAIIDLRALSRNLALVKKLVGSAKIMAVVKADAYGHGLVPVSRRLVAEGAAALGVGRVEEVEDLRRAGLGVPVVILTGILPQEAAQAVRLRSLPLVFDLETAEALASVARSMGRTAEVLIKIDTGLGRLGLDCQDLSGLVDRLQLIEGLTVRGLASHLSNAEEADKTTALAQIERFKAAISLFKDRGFDLDLNSLAASSGVLDLKASHFDLVRPGIMLYGCRPGPGIKNPLDPEPVMTVKTRLIQVRDMPAGSPLSYGGTYVTPDQARIGVVALGYGHGLGRSLSATNQTPGGQMLVHGRRAPIVGRVCMNLTLLDLADCPEAEVGDEVVVLGRQGEEVLRAEEMAQAWGTVSNEVLCLLGGLNPRTYLDLP